MEVVKLDLSHSSPDTGCDGLAGISHEVRDAENLGTVLHVRFVLDLEVPVVWQLQWQTGMVGRLHDDDVRTEVGSQQQTQGFDHVGLLWFASRETELCELLIWSQHNQLWAEYNSEIRNKLCPI